MKVFVYFNLHKKCWSVRALDGPSKGRVIKHTNVVYLEDATFKVSEAGRQRVLRDRCKNIHAGVMGHLVAVTAIAKDRVRYNPYRAPQFTDEAGFYVASAKRVSMAPNGVVYADGLTRM